MTDDVTSVELFYIVSIKWTRRREKYITFWRPNDAGYSSPLTWSGKYSRAEVESRLGYYNNGEFTIAVPCAVVDALGVAPERNHIDNDAGPVVINNADNWHTLIAAVIAPPRVYPQPQYRGAPRERKAA